MSEPIQSISQGNYILQGNVATSSGIVGDGTTQNPLRADETVLWSGTRTNEVTLSESAYNFEFIRIELDEDSSNAPNPIITIKPSAVMTFGYCYGMANAFLAFVYATLTNNNKLTFVSTKSVQFGSFTNTNVGLTATLNVDQVINSIVKVVGINRKAQ